MSKRKHEYDYPADQPEEQEVPEEPVDPGFGQPEPEPAEPQQPPETPTETEKRQEPNPWIG